MAEAGGSVCGFGSGSGICGGGGGVILITAPVEQPRIRINKWRVREGVPVSHSQVVLLYEAVDENGEQKDKTVLKLKASRVGVVRKRLYKEGDVVEQGVAVLEMSECVHTTVIKDMCADCGADLRQNENGNTSEASVPMVHSIPDLKVTQKLAQKLGHDDTRRLLQDRKLVLLVDLDQTVIHTTNDNVPNNIKGIYHFQLYGPHSPWYHTRLRPGTPQFLELMSKYYELHICTFGARNYAHMIAQLLDPDGKYFSHRILSRDECFNATSKTDNLKALFPNGDSMVCIIDDREDVWNMASNLIQVKPYHFFQHTGDINAPPGLSKHELDGEGVDFKDLNSLATDKDNLAEATATQCKVNSEESKTHDETLESSDDDCSAQMDPKKTVKSDEPKVSAPTPPVPSTASEQKNSVLDGKEKSEISTENVEVEITSVSVAAVPNEGQQSTQVTSTTETSVAEQAAKGDNQQPAAKEGAESQSDSTTTLTIVDNHVLAPKFKMPIDPRKQIEIEDPDDYLLHLEVILQNIHARFYAIYDETQEIPDLKIIVPKIRSEVLRAQNLVFSGLVPTNMQLEQSRAYFIAKSLGANVSQNFSADTTHLVAVTSGTFKVNAAKKNPQIKIVNASWLWSCAERWEHVDEKLYPLDRNTKSKQRQPPAHCHSPEHVVNYSDKSEISSSSSALQLNASVSEKFIDTINPLLSFSHADLADMNEEFEQFFESDSSIEDEPVNIENPPEDKSLRKRKREEKEEERTREFFTRDSELLLVEGSERELDKSSNEEDDDDESPGTKFRRGEDLPSDLEVGSESPDTDSDNNPDTEDDGDWNMMGAALEREFLGLED